MKKRIANLPVSVVNAYAEIFTKLDNEKYLMNWKKFRNCSAMVSKTDKNIILMSYRTIVAIFDKESKTVFARGRYSATTYQHVRKFADECGTRKVENLELVNWY